MSLQCRTLAREGAGNGYTPGVALFHPTHLGLVTYPAGATFGPRAMTDFELVWVIEGDAVYGRNDVLYPCPAESIVLCIPGTTDYFRWDPRRPTRHAYFHFTPPADLLRTPGLDGDPAGWPVVRRLDKGDVIRPLIRHLLRWYRAEEKPGRGLSELIDATMRSVLLAYVLGKEATNEVFESTAPPAVEKASAEIRRRLERDMTAPVELADLARAASVTPEHLCRLFRKHTGRSPAETVRLARLDRASVLMSRSNYTVGEVAELCGFASQFHFSRAFKRAFGESPTELRERVRRGGTPPVPRLLRGLTSTSPS